MNGQIHFGIAHIHLINVNHIDRAVLNTYIHIHTYIHTYTLSLKYTYIHHAGRALMGRSLKVLCEFKKAEEQLSVAIVLDDTLAILYTG